MKSVILVSASDLFEAWRGRGRYHGGGMSSASSQMPASDKQKQFIRDLVGKLTPEILKTALTSTSIGSLAPKENQDAFWKQVFELAKLSDEQLAKINTLNKGDASNLIDALRGSSSLAGWLSFFHDQPFDRMVAKVVGNEEYIKGREAADAAKKKAEDEAEQEAKEIRKRKTKLTRAANEYHKARGGDKDRGFDRSHRATEPEHLRLEGKKKVKASELFDRASDAHGYVTRFVYDGKVYMPRSKTVQGKLIAEPVGKGEKIVIDPDADVYVQDKPDDLIEAARIGDIKAIEELLKEKIFSHADIDEALGIAVGASETEAARLLLTHGARPPFHLTYVDAIQGEREFGGHTDVFKKVEGFYRHARRLGLEDELLSKLGKHERELIERIRDRYHVAKHSMTDSEVEYDSARSLAAKTERELQKLMGSDPEEFKRSLQALTQVKTHPDFHGRRKESKNPDAMIHDVDLGTLFRHAVEGGHADAARAIAKLHTEFRKERWSPSYRDWIHHKWIAKANALGLWKLVDEMLSASEAWGKHTDGAVKVTGPGREGREELEITLDDEGKSYKLYWYPHLLMNSKEMVTRPDGQSMQWFPEYSAEGPKKNIKKLRDFLEKSE